MAWFCPCVDWCSMRSRVLASAFVATTAIATLSSPQMLAWPAPIPWWLSRSHRAARRPRPQARWPAPRRADREADRSATRAALAAAAVKQASRRAKALAKHGKSVAAEARLKAAAARAAAAAARARLPPPKRRPRGSCSSACIGQPWLSAWDDRSTRHCAADLEEQVRLRRRAVLLLQQHHHPRGMWNIYATNPSSGAYGIPQALPGSKMASVGSDWRTNPATQIILGIGYMKDRYGSPCQAWTFKRARLVLALEPVYPGVLPSWLVPSPSSAEGGSSPARRGRRRAALRSASRRSRTRTRGRPDGSSCPP